MRYLMTIQRIEEDPQYETILKEWEERNRYNNTSRYDVPRNEKITNALTVILTQEQFDAIKKASLETF